LAASSSSSTRMIATYIMFFYVCFAFKFSYGATGQKTSREPLSETGIGEAVTSQIQIHPGICKNYPLNVSNIQTATLSVGEEEKQSALMLRISN
jgi:hypothetical protein